MNTTPNSLNDLDGFYEKNLGEQTICDPSSPSPTPCAPMNVNLATQVGSSTDPNSKYYNMSLTPASPNYTTFTCGPNKFIKVGDKYTRPGYCSNSSVPSPPPHPPSPYKTEYECEAKQQTWHLTSSSSAHNYCQLSAGYLDKTATDFTFFTNDNGSSAWSNKHTWEIDGNISGVNDGTGFIMNDANMSACVNETDYGNLIY
jgi:hypothetical protein